MKNYPAPNANSAEAGTPRLILSSVRHTPKLKEINAKFVFSLVCWFNAGLTDTGGGRVSFKTVVLCVGGALKSHGVS